MERIGKADPEDFHDIVWLTQLREKALKSVLRQPEVADAYRQVKSPVKHIDIDFTLNKLILLRNTAIVVAALDALFVATSALISIRYEAPLFSLMNCNLAISAALGGGLAYSLVRASRSITEGRGQAKASQKLKDEIERRREEITDIVKSVEFMQQIAVACAEKLSQSPTGKAMLDRLNATLPRSEVDADLSVQGVAMHPVGRGAVQRPERHAAP